MKKLLIFALMTFCVMGTQAQPKSWTADNGNGTFTNPLFYDEFSDPDVIRVWPARRCTRCQDWSFFTRRTW